MFLRHLLCFLHSFILPLHLPIFRRSYAPVVRRFFVSNVHLSSSAPILYRSATFFFSPLCSKILALFSHPFFSFLCVSSFCTAVLSLFSFLCDSPFYTTVQRLNSIGDLSNSCVLQFRFPLFSPPSAVPSFSFSAFFLCDSPFYITVQRLNSIGVLRNCCVLQFRRSSSYPFTRFFCVQIDASYRIQQGTFLPLVVPPTVFQAGLWSIWLVVLCSLKMFQALARDRLERLNASPSVIPRTYFCVYSALFVFSVDMLWIRLCLAVYSSVHSPTFLLLFFEPLNIAFETLQGFFPSVFVCVSHGPFANLQVFITSSKMLSFVMGLFSVGHRGSWVSGSLWEWKGILNRNLGFLS